MLTVGSPRIYIDGDVFKFTTDMEFKADSMTSRSLSRIMQVADQASEKGEWGVLPLISPQPHHLERCFNII
jgi:hypothetical protein